MRFLLVGFILCWAICSEAGEAERTARAVQEHELTPKLSSAIGEAVLLSMRNASELALVLDNGVSDGSVDGRPDYVFLVTLAEPVAEPIYWVANDAVVRVLFNGDKLAGLRVLSRSQGTDCTLRIGAQSLSLAGIGSGLPERGVVVAGLASYSGPWSADLTISQLEEALVGHRSGIVPALLDERSSCTAYCPKGKCKITCYHKTASCECVGQFEDLRPLCYCMG